MKPRLGTGKIPFQLGVSAAAPIPPAVLAFLLDLYIYSIRSAEGRLSDGTPIDAPSVYDQSGATAAIGSGLVLALLMLSAIGSVAGGILFATEQASPAAAIGSGQVQAPDVPSPIAPIGSGVVQPAAQVSATGAIGSGIIVLSETTYD